MSYENAIELGTMRTRQSADDLQGEAAERRARNIARHPDPALASPEWNCDETDPATWAGEPVAVE